MIAADTNRLTAAVASEPASAASLGVPSRAKRWAVTLLGALLLAQGLGKALDLTGYAAALQSFDALPAALLWPVALLWTTVELLSGAGLLATGLRLDPPRRASRGAAALGVAIAIGYALLTSQAYLRGLDVANCTCFGVYLAQRLSWFVLLQDAYMLIYSGWVLRKTAAWAKP